ncbi:DUF3267 domain-containing protein [Bacillus cereus group sp. BY112LC]|uniref:DUF3267 domain-containing protein n=1 Tax=Bacillus cereus group sp. BY112LC TaxID=3018086 RepID=UPI0022E27A6E|nr:DUF3267 domain-containing protein [Bacillus cereus group sp. BY112LC]MDA1877678.1 DUF3267 domain-containing protein [Bacillus cereus group sp. BY112LC]
MAKIKNSIPKGDKTLDIKLIQDGWIPMKEPKNFINTLLLSVPFMIINTLISIGIINIFSDISIHEFGLTEEGVFITIDLISLLLIVFLVILHELIHLIFIPNFIKSEKTWIGLTLFGGFVATEEEISKLRFVFITIAPFFIISILTPLLFSIFGALTTNLKCLILLNSMGSSVDMLTLLLILKQVPPNGILRNNGSRTYWKCTKVKAQTLKS